MPDLAPQSLRISACHRPVRLDDHAAITDRLYLEIEGTPSSFRFLAELLQEMADNADNSNDPQRGHSIVLDPADSTHLSLVPWAALSLACRRQLPPVHDSI